MEELLTYEDIGKLLKYSPRYVRDKVMKDKDAPLPVFPGRYRQSDINRFLSAVQARSRRGCNTPSRVEDRASQTSCTDQEH